MLRKRYVINHKKVYRIYREEGLQMRRKRRRKRLPPEQRRAWALPIRPGIRWSMDFMRDCLRGGRPFRILNVLDDCARECLKAVVDTSISGRRVVRELDDLISRVGKPHEIVVDNGPEFACSVLADWAEKHAIEIRFIEKGKPHQNAFVESYNGTFRDECLNESLFQDLSDARIQIEDWRVDYNNVRPHSSPGGLAPTEFKKRFDSVPAA